MSRGGHRQDGPEVFGENDAEVAELVQQSAGRVVLTVLAGRTRQQRGRRDRRYRLHERQPAGGVGHFGFSRRRWADEHQPDGVAGQQIRDERGEHDLEQADVFEVEPPAERHDRVVERARLDVRRRRLLTGRLIVGRWAELRLSRGLGGRRPGCRPRTSRRARPWCRPPWQVDDATLAPRLVRKFANRSSARYTDAFVMTSLSKQTYTTRSSSATASQSPSAVRAPFGFVPRHDQTPSNATQHSPADTALSALRAPSVTYSATAGSPSWSWMGTGTSSTIRSPWRVTSLSCLPRSRWDGRAGTGTSAPRR